MKIEHIAMYVNNLENAKVFFEKYFDAKSNTGYHNPNTDFKSYFLTFDDGARLEIMKKPQMEDDEKTLTRTTGDGYYESCIIGIEGNQIEITV